LENWEDTFDELIERLTAACRAVDPQSTDEVLEGGLGNRDFEDALPQPLRRR
jgi:hypothetical protein